MKKEYLGDGVYAEYDGFGVTLSTPRQYGTHWIYFEPEVMQRLLEFVSQSKNTKDTKL